jgi:hypothetical protein
MSELGRLASGIYTSEFDSDSCAANYGQISGWLSENLGLLNTLINTNFSGQNPSLGLEEGAIYKEVYLYNYYNKQARNILRGITATSNAGDNILSVSDGDNSISFVNRNEVGKVYRDLAKESKQKLDGLITKYTIYESQPLQVGGYESVSYEAQIAAAAAGAATQIPVTGDAGSEETLDDEAQIYFSGPIPEGGFVDAPGYDGSPTQDGPSMGTVFAMVTIDSPKKKKKKKVVEARMTGRYKLAKLMQPHLNAMGDTAAKLKKNSDDYADVVKKYPAKPAPAKPANEEHTKCDTDDCCGECK